MKVLKSLAVLTTVLALGACKTAPGGGGSVPPSLDSALGESIGDLGGTAGLTRYNYRDETVDPDATYIVSTSFFINMADPKEIKEATAVLVSGTMQGSDNKDYPVSNQLQTQGSFIYGSLTVEPTPSGITAAEYTFYKSTCTKSDGKLYDPSKGAFTEVKDSFGNVTKGETHYFAIKDEGSQITVKQFSLSLPSDQATFDRETTTYKK